MLELQQQQQQQQNLITLGEVNYIGYKTSFGRVKNQSFWNIIYHETSLNNVLQIKRIVYSALNYAVIGTK